MISDFAQLLWLFNSPRETRNIIRLDLHEAGLLYKYASQQWKILPKTRKGNIILEIGTNELIFWIYITHERNEMNFEISPNFQYYFLRDLS